MNVTAKSVIIEKTNRTHGMLEQGGVSGRRVAYALADVARVTGLTADQLAAAADDDDCPGYTYISIRDVIEEKLVGRVLRRGHRIQ